MSDASTIPAARLPWHEGKHAPDSVRSTVHHPAAPEPRQLSTGGRLSHWAPREPASVAESWRRQVLLVDDRGVRLRLQAQLALEAFGAVAAHQPTTHPWPLRELLIVGSVLGTVATLADEAERRRDDLRRHWFQYGVKTLPGQLAERASEWVEPATVTVGARRGFTDWQSRVFARAREFAIERVVRVAEGRWEVLDLTGAEPQVVSSDACTITREVDRRCPLLDSPDSGQYCHLVGGPWVSASIDAAGAWKQRWRALNEAVGCDTCKGERYMFQQKVVRGGGPIELTPTPGPTRWLRAIGTRH